MLAYFFAFRYIIKLYKCQKRQFCLGSITKCDVIRSSGGLQSRVKQSSHLKNSVLRIFHNGAMVLLEFRFLALGASANSQDGLQGVDGICDASLASRDCTLSTGGAQES